jgi:hypothetical protein
MSPTGTNRKKEKDFTLKYKRYPKPYMSPTGINRTKEKDFTLKNKGYPKPYKSLTGTNLFFCYACPCGAHIRLWIPLVL